MNKKIYLLILTGSMGLFQGAKAMQNLGQSGVGNPKPNDPPVSFKAPMIDPKVNQLTNAVSTANNLGEIFTLTSGKKDIFRNAVLEYYQKKYKDDLNEEFQLQEGTLKKQDVLKMLEKTSTAPIHIQKEILQSALICTELFLFSQNSNAKINIPSLIKTIDSLYGINFAGDVLSPHTANFSLINSFLKGRIASKQRSETLSSLAALSQFQDLDTLTRTFKSFSGKELKDVLLDPTSTHFDQLFTTLQFCKTFPEALKQSDKVILFENTEFKKSILKLHAENKFELLLKMVKSLYDFDLSSAPLLSPYSPNRLVCEKAFNITPESFELLKLLDRLVSLKAEQDKRPVDFKDLVSVFACWQNDNLGDVLLDPTHSRFESLKLNLEFSVEFPQTLSKGIIFKSLEVKSPLLQLKKAGKFAPLAQAFHFLYQSDFLEDLLTLFSSAHHSALNVLNAAPRTQDLFLKLYKIREHKDFQTFKESFEQSNSTTFQDVLFNPYNSNAKELQETLEKELDDFGKSPPPPTERTLDTSTQKDPFVQWAFATMNKTIVDMNNQRFGEIIKRVNDLSFLSVEQYLSLHKITAKLLEAGLEKKYT